MDTPFPILSDEEPKAQPPARGASVATPASDAADFSAASAVLASATQTAPQAGLHEALSLALETAPQVIDNLVGRAMLGMDRQATAHPDAKQRALLDAAAAAMDGQRRRWSKQFVGLLRVAFAHPPADAAALLPVDLRVCEQEMAQLDALVLAAGSQRGNPLGPASYSRALFELISRSEVRHEMDQEIRNVWAHFLLGALGTQLAWAYLQMASCVRTPGARDVSEQASAPEFASYADYVYGLGGVAPPDEQAPDAPKLEMTPEMRALAQEARRTVAQLRMDQGFPPDPKSSGVCGR